MFKRRELCRYSSKRSFVIFSIFTESALGGGVKPVVDFKMFVLATVPAHETSLANQHFYSMLLGRGMFENAEKYGWSFRSPNCL